MLTYSTAIKTDLLSYINTNLVAVLINYPELGIDNTPTQDELTARRALTMTVVGTKEIASTGGYVRKLVPTTAATDIDNNQVYTLSINTSFTPTGANYEEATHIVYARGAVTTRGSTQGTIVCVEEITNAPYIIVNGVTYTHSTTIDLG